MSVWLTANITESNVNTTNNTSDVTVQLYANWDLGSYNLMNPAGWLSIDGDSQQFSHSFNSNRTQTGSELLVSRTKTIAHDADGSKTVSVSAWFDSEVSSGQITWSGSKRLTTIARASQPSLGASSVVMGHVLQINTNRQSIAFTHTLQWAFGDSKGTIATGATTGASWIVPLALANQIPNATSGKGTIICYTYNGKKLVGMRSVEFTAAVPTSVVPTIQGVTAEETVAGIAAKFGAFVQGKSKVKITTQAEAQYSATVSRIAVDVSGQSLVGATVTTDALTASGTVDAVVTVKDSRGRTSQQTKALTVLPYASPAISFLSIFRATGTAADTEGTAVGVYMAFAISPCDNKNDKSYELEYRIQGAEQWSTLVSGSLYSYNDEVWFSNADLFSVDYSFEFRLTVEDFFSSTTAFAQIDTGFSLIDWRSTGKGIAFGKASEKDAFECALDFDLSGDFVQEEEQKPTLLNSWVNYESPYKDAGYSKDPFGYVHLCGMIKNGKSADGTGLFILPAGYRPSRTEKFVVSSMNLPCIIDVSNIGIVSIKSGANSGWISLSGIVFKAE